MKYIARHTTEDDYAFSRKSATGTSDWYVIIQDFDQPGDNDALGPFGTEEEAEQAAWETIAETFDDLFEEDEDGNQVYIEPIDEEDEEDEEDEYPTEKNSPAGW